jgi:hypothetical protein
MTLAEMKIKVYSLIEEYDEDADELTKDEDLATKMNGVINQIQTELARFKKIGAYKEIEVQEGDIKDFSDIDENIYQINVIKGLNCEIIDKKILCNETGTAKVFYFKYPTLINEDTEDDEYVFELDKDALEIMPYGVAADLLKSDVSANFGQIYAQRYNQFKSELDSRNTMPSITFEGGINI